MEAAPWRARGPEGAAAAALEQRARGCGRPTPMLGQRVPDEAGVRRGRRASTGRGGSTGLRAVSWTAGPRPGSGSGSFVACVGHLADGRAAARACRSPAGRAAGGRLWTPESDSPAHPHPSWAGSRSERDFHSPPFMSAPVRWERRRRLCRAWSEVTRMNYGEGVTMRVNQGHCTASVALTLGTRAPASCRGVLATRAVARGLRLSCPAWAGAPGSDPGAHGRPGPLCLFSQGQGD